MPPLIVWGFGVVGVAAAAKWLLKEAQRINDELDAIKAQRSGEPAGNSQSLERDPHTGIYRPK